MAWEEKRLEEKHIFLSVTIMLLKVILLSILVLVLILIVSLEFFIHEVPLFHFSFCWQILVQALCVVWQLFIICVLLQRDFESTLLAEGVSLCFC